jgi:hypothetical protein
MKHVASAVSLIDKEIVPSVANFLGQCNRVESFVSQTETMSTLPAYSADPSGIVPPPFPHQVNIELCYQIYISFPLSICM